MEGTRVQVGVFPTPMTDEERGVKLRIIRFIAQNANEVSCPTLDDLPLGGGRVFQVLNRVELTEVLDWEVK